MPLKILCRAVPLAVAALLTMSTLALAEDAAAPPAIATKPQMTAVVAPADAEHWTAYGYNVTAPASMWPMLELLHQQHFDWELASAGQRPTPLIWANLPSGIYGQYVPKQNVVKVSWLLQTESVVVGTAFLAHELTHLTDDLNG